MPLPLISVIMPAHNAAATIGAAINGIVAQTHKNWELIIIDDASVDNTAAIVKTYQQDDKRIRYYRNKKNSKQWAARNRGLSLARGTYIAWQDADDISAPTRLMTQLRLLLAARGRTQLVSTDMVIINDDGQMQNRLHSYSSLGDKIVVTAKHHSKSPRNFYNLHRQRLFCPTIMFEKKILKLLVGPPCRPLPIGEDIDLLYRLLEQGAKLTVLQKPLYYYRRSHNQSTHFHLLSLLYGEVARYCAYDRRTNPRPYDIVAQLCKNKTWLQPQDLATVFAFFLRQPHLHHYHGIFMNRFMVGLFYGLITNPMIFLLRLPLVARVTYRLFYTQPFLFLRSLLLAVGSNLFRFFICRYRRRVFFVE